MVKEPIAWLHEDAERVDVIHTDVKKLLSSVAGHLHRPLDKGERYTIPLYSGEYVAELEKKITELQEALIVAVKNLKNVDVSDKDVEIIEEALAIEGSA